MLETRANRTLNPMTRLLFGMLVSTVLGASILATIVALPPLAGAHAELLEASPDRSETVGGVVDVISLQFVGLANPGDHDVLVLDPLGNQVEVFDLEQELHLLTVSIAPIDIEGEYIVSYQTDGIDDDLSTGSYVFTYDTAADPPNGIDHKQQTPSTDWVTVALIAITAAASLGWLLYAARRLRAPQPDPDDPSAIDDADDAADAGGHSDQATSVDSDKVDEQDESLAGADIGFNSSVTKRKIGRDNN